MDDIYTNRPVLSKDQNGSRIRELASISETDSWAKSQNFLHSGTKTQSGTASPVRPPDQFFHTVTTEARDSGYSFIRATEIQERSWQWGSDVWVLWFLEQLFYRWLRSLTQTLCKQNLVFYSPLFLPAVYITLSCEHSTVPTITYMHLCKYNTISLS